MNNLLTIQNSKISMEVELTNPNPSYRISKSNPVKGSRFECTGIITFVDRYIEILWKNGSTNVYQNNELSLVNHANTYHSIW